MSDLISRQAAIKAFYIQSDDDGWWVGAAQDAETLLNGLPTAEKVGKWIEIEKGLYVTKYKCSECRRVIWDDTGYDVCTDYPYCHCGARMEGNER